MKKFVSAFLLISSACWGDDCMNLLISPQEISQKVQEVAKVIDQQYQGEELNIIMVMKGAICITADLMRNLHVPVTIDYISASSYGAHGTERGELRVSGLDKLDLSSKNVLIVDDIFDTGATMTTLVSRVQEKNPKSLKTLVLLVKDVPRKTTYRPDYTLFEIENHFVIGYGLDYKENYRELPGIYFFANDTPPN